MVGSLGGGGFSFCFCADAMVVQANVGDLRIMNRSTHTTMSPPARRIDDPCCRSTTARRRASRSSLPPAVAPSRRLPHQISVGIVTFERSLRLCKHRKRAGQHAQPKKPIERPRAQPKQLRDLIQTHSRCHHQISDGLHLYLRPKVATSHPNEHTKCTAHSASSTNIPGNRGLGEFHTKKGFKR